MGFDNANIYGRRKGADRGTDMIVENYNIEYERYVGHHDTGDWLDDKRKKLQKGHAVPLDTKKGNVLPNNDNGRKG